MARRESSSLYTRQQNRKAPVKPTDAMRRPEPPTYLVRKIY